MANSAQIITPEILARNVFFPKNVLKLSKDGPEVFSDGCSGWVDSEVVEVVIVVASQSMHGR